MHIGEFSFEIAKVKSKCDFYSEGTALLVYKTYFSKKETAGYAFFILSTLSYKKRPPSTGCR